MRQINAHSLVMRVAAGSKLDDNDHLIASTSQPDVPEEV
jgi:hypothetical protein